MIKKTNIFASLLVITAITIHAQEVNDKVLIDEIKAIVDGPSNTDIITLSDIERRSFDGQAHKLDDLIQECAGKQHSEVLGIPVEEDDVLRYLRAVAQSQQQEATVTPDALKATAAHAGFDSLDEFYTALKRLYGANAAMDMEMRSLTAVSEQDIAAYDEKNPLYKPATYVLQTAFVEQNESSSTDEQKAQLQKTAATDHSLKWSIAFDIAESDIAPEKSFIKTLKKNEIYVSDTAHGFELYRLKNNMPKQRIPAQDRKKEIITKLREEKFNKAVAQYRQDRRDEVKITTF